MAIETQLDATFSALGDATRRAIISRLLDGEVPLAKLAEPFAMSQTAVSRHVRVLADAGLVSIEKRGRTRHCRLQVAPMKAAVDWLSEYEAFWQDNFASLKAHLEQEISKP